MQEDQRRTFSIMKAGNLMTQHVQEMEKRTEIKKLPLMLVLLSGAFAAILNQTLLATAIPHIMADLELEADVAQWLQSVFMLVNGIMIPVTAFLIGKFTTRRLFFTAITLFDIGTLVYGTALNFTILLIWMIMTNLVDFIFMAPQIHYKHH